MDSTASKRARPAHYPNASDPERAEDEMQAAVQRALDDQARRSAPQPLSPLAKANPLVPLGMVALTLVLALLSVAFTLQT